MPKRVFIHYCSASEKESYSSAPACQDCGKKGKFIGWTVSSIVERMCQYQQRTGLKPIGLHRHYADVLLRDMWATCAECTGSGFAITPVEETWASCQVCNGTGRRVISEADFKLAIARILELYPEAAVGAPITHTKTEEAAQPSKHVKKNKLKCEFMNLIIKNALLEAKYEGGVKSFTRKHLCKYNHELTIISSMSYDFDEAIDDLKENGLKPEDDFMVLDVGFGPASITYSGAVIRGGTFPIIINSLSATSTNSAKYKSITVYGYKWLKGYEHREEFKVSLNKEKNADKPKGVL